MNKKIISLLCCILLFNLVFAVEKSPVDEDFEYLKTCLTQCWVGYDEVVKKGFNLDKCIRKMKVDYKLSKANHQKKKNSNKNYVVYNDVDNWAMTYAIQKNLMSELDDKIRDAHFFVYGDKNGGSLSPLFLQFYSTVYFEKNGEEFFVCSSNEEKIKPGMKYTGDKELLLPWIQNGKLMYRFGVKNQYLYKDTKINLDNKNYKVSLTYFNAIPTIKNHVGFVTTENTVYVSLSDCILNGKTEHETKEIREHFDLVMKDLRENNQKKNLILDLRGNSGGYEIYPKQILQSYFYGNDDVKAYTFNSFYDVFNTGTISLESLEIAEKAYEDMKKNFFDDERKIQNALDKVNELKANTSRSYLGLHDPVMSQLPQIKSQSYNGKIFVLIDKNTASAAEVGTALSFYENKNSVVLVGENSWGCIDFGGKYEYVLPNSKVRVTLCFNDGRKRAGIAQNEHWHGDTYGFYPDYYATSENLMDSLVYLTGDSDLPKVLAGIEKELK